MSPFKSKKQARYMFKFLPSIAKRWAKITNFKKLPKRKAGHGKRER